jgi:hypothetical protein
MTLSITIKYVQGHIYQTASSLNILKGKKYKCDEAMIQQAYVYYNITVSFLPCFLDLLIGTIKVNLCQENLKRSEEVLSCFINS